MSSIGPTTPPPSVILDLEDPDPPPPPRTPFAGRTPAEQAAILDPWGDIVLPRLLAIVVAGIGLKPAIRESRIGLRALVAGLPPGDMVPPPKKAKAGKGSKPLTREKMLALIDAMAAVDAEYFTDELQALFAEALGSGSF